MQKYYLHIAVDAPLDRLFDYLPIAGTEADEYKPGQRVIVPFGRTSKTGILINISTSSQLTEKQLKPIKQRLDDIPLLSDEDIKLIQWAAGYYFHPVGEVFVQTLPKKLRIGETPNEVVTKYYSLSKLGASLSDKELKRSPRQANLWTFLNQLATPVSKDRFNELPWNWKPALKQMLDKGWVSSSEASPEVTHIPIAAPFAPNASQQSAIDRVIQAYGSFQSFLLDGVTGSGKTEVYLQLIQHALSLGQQVLILLPEITLTPQLAARFHQRLACEMVVYHSGLSDTQRAQAWLKLRSGRADILLGTRSAVFTPMKNPGLIIMDEEHDSSFKQQEGFRYSARDVAIVRAKNCQIPIVLGSATPSLESLYNVQQGRFDHLSLPERTGGAQHPDVRLIDCRNQSMPNHLSTSMIKAINATLSRQEQVILFVNRRGFAPVLMCHSCGWVAQCKRCDSRLVIHKKQQQLKCHHCGAEHSTPDTCPSCQQDELFPLGTGTERLEETLASLYPNIPLTRIDRDSTRKKNAMQSIIDQVNQGGAQLLVGTQMLAKGHHFANVTLVGIIDIDSGLFSVDYRAGERMAQLIVQVAGRAGREEKPGRVLIQTHQPEHHLLQTLIQQDYASFAQEALIERQQAALPPFHYQALLRVNAANEQDVLSFLNDAQEHINQLSNPNISIFGPVPAPMLKRAGRFRYQLLFQTSHRHTLHHFLRHFLPTLTPLKSSRKVRWSIDIDPIDMF